MDPDAAWKSLAEFDYGDPMQASQWRDVARDLFGWLKRGGFPPKITGNVELDRLAAKATCIRLLCFSGVAPSERLAPRTSLVGGSVAQHELDG